MGPELLLLAADGFRSVSTGAGAAEGRDGNKMGLSTTELTDTTEVELLIVVFVALQNKEGG